MGEDKQIIYYSNKDDEVEVIDIGFTNKNTTTDTIHVNREIGKVYIQ